MTDPLAKYKSKREFDETSEPKGKKEKGGNRHRFVIQLHHAKKARDHYDLRLENDNGTLSSWSIPKHKLPKGKEKLLAIKTEDHPVEYLKFKGEIAAGYGAGTVEIHDSGTYEEIEASRTKIVFRLKGKKEKGIYKLFRAGGGNKWMVMEASSEKKASDGLPISKRAAKTVIVLQGGKQKEPYEYDEGGNFRSWNPRRGMSFDEKLEGIPVSLKHWPENKGELNGRFMVSESQLHLQFESELEDQRTVFAPLDQLVLPPDMEIIWAPDTLVRASYVSLLSKSAAHSGAMLALMAPPAIAKKMRKAKMVEDKELSDVLHMTLLYLGKAADLDDKTLAAVKRAVERVCARHMPLEMSVSGAGMFTPEKDGTPVYVVPNAKGLSALQADLEEAVGNIIELPSEHGWVPHMTVCYSCDDKPELPDLTEKLEWTADKVRIQVGGEKFADIPIGRRKRGGDDPPLSRRADQVKRTVKPLFREPALDERMWKGIWETYDDPVKHMREDKPRVILPQNIPDWAVAAEGLERPQDLPSGESLEPSDPNGRYYVVDMDDNIVARYATKDKAVRNAENLQWSSRVFHSEYDDPWDVFVYMEKGDKPVVWERSPESTRKMLAELRAKRGPYYLVDYWGRVLASYDSLDQAIRNAEGNMYVSQITFSMVDDPDRGKVVWTKPESTTVQSLEVFPLSKRADSLPLSQRTKTYQ